MRLIFCLSLLPLASGCMASDSPSADGAVIAARRKTKEELAAAEREAFEERTQQRIKESFRKDRPQNEPFPLAIQPEISNEPISVPRSDGRTPTRTFPKRSSAADDAHVDTAVKKFEDPLAKLKDDLIRNLQRLQNPLDEPTTTPSPRDVEFKRRESEFHVGPLGPLTRVENVSDCTCGESVYAEEWCPFGASQSDCARAFLTLPPDSHSVFSLTSDSCSLHFECGDEYSLYGNVYLPLGVFPQPSNLEKEITTAESNGFSTAFECSPEGNFELVFVSAKRRIVFVVHDLACVRRLRDSETPAPKRARARVHAPSHTRAPTFSQLLRPIVGFENPNGFRG